MVKESTHGSYWTIDGEVYDLSPLLDPKHEKHFKHPGGMQIIIESRGTDATFLFHSYHWRGLPNIEKYKLPNVKAEINKFSRDCKKDEFYKEVKEECAKHLKGKPIKVSWQCWRWLLPIMGFTIWLLAQMLKGSWIALFISPIFYYATMLTVFHQSEHYAVSKNPIIKFLICVYSAWFLDPATWRARHHYSHHVYTNVLGYDADVNHNYYTHRSLPNAKYQRHFRFAYALYYVINGVAFHFLTAFNLGLVFGRIIAMKFFRTYPLHVIDFWFFLFLKWGCLFLTCVRPFYVFPLWKALIFAIYFPSAMSLQITIGSSQNHISEPTTKESRDDEFLDESWAKHQIMTATNWCNFREKYTNSLDDWGHLIFAWISYFWSGGANYQIEHHLMPGLCNDALVEVAPIVRRLCAKHNVPYPHFDGWTYLFRSHLNVIANLNNKESVA